ncbi:hypothetical protein GCM10010193_69630 [Kitasatospora atroaurantiaca]|uniref:Uncharacterized protein n=1 Tax=Kitasatospora atroaurantiaca TaxID=285545 RepID=A0A561EN47_9ACTN|nr:hypothetical protein [Kitasatospora atroaurantiaca]TWE17048.1 hypothetical protein FB465_2052 [Kitasatospora atroaurantiaca]
MNATARNAIRRMTAAVRTAVQNTRAAWYAALNGRTINDALAIGWLIRTSEMLDRLFIDLPDGQQSWYGRHVVKAYRATHGRDPLKAWVQHRTTGRWIHVYVYAPDDKALIAGLWSYKATRPVAAALFSETA